MTPPSDRPPTLAREIGERAHAIEQVLEHTLADPIEHGLQIAEESIARRFGARAVKIFQVGLRVLLWSVIALLFGFGITMLAARYWVLPHIDEWRPQVEAIASDALDAPVTIGRIEASWRSLNPVIALVDVTVSGRSGGAVLALPRIEGTLSWASLPALEPRFARLRIHAPELEIVLLEGGRLAIAGFIVDPGRGGGDGAAVDWLLAQDTVVIRDARLRLRDERGPQPREILFSDASLRLESGFGSTKFGLQLAPPPALAANVDIRGDFSRPTFGHLSDFRRWSGDLFARVDYVDLAQLNDWVGAPLAVQRAQGALRVWLTLDATDIVSATADLALTDVDARLAKDLESLQLSSFQGRVTHRRWSNEAGDGLWIALSGVSFTLASGVNFPPLDFMYRSVRSGSGPPHVEVEGSRIDLKGIAAIATHLPLGRELLGSITRHAPDGRLAEFSLRWDGDEPQWTSLAGTARFDQLSIAAETAKPDRPAWPGFERLSGIVQFDRGSGSLELTSRDAALTFPGVFPEPRIPLNQLTAAIRWKGGDSLEARIATLSLSNTDIELSASGTWRAAGHDGGPGAVDLSGRIVRIDARSAYRYVPLAAGTGTISWLKNALLAGQVTDGTFRLRGDLAEFPYSTPATGEFKLAARVRDAVLDVAPEVGPQGERSGTQTWPLISDIDAEVVFERQSMTIRAQRGLIADARISDSTTARIPDLGHNATLEVRGQLSGSLAALVEYVNSSPVAGWTGHITQDADAKGLARVELKLDVPLLHAADTRVAGVLQFQNNDLTLADVPPLSRINGALSFTERGVSFSNLAAVFLGGQARLDASTRAGGEIVVAANGIATPTGLRRALDVDLVHRILDRTQGSARYAATLSVQHGAMTLQADSDLTGFTIDGVAPLRKSAGETLPLRLEKSMRDGADDVVVTAGRLVGVRLERRRAGDRLGLVRGVIALNEPANLPERGLLVLVSAPRFDVDAWASWLGIGVEQGTGASAGAGGDDLQIDHIALRTPELLVTGRTFRDVTLGATRTESGGYDVNVVSEGVAGYLGWRPGARGARGGAGLGLVSARLSKLRISTERQADVVDALRAPASRLPALDVSVENFELGGKQLGRLELAAANSGAGKTAAWTVSRIEISNPDMKLTASGDWLPGPTGALRTQVKFAIDANDAGATLARFGVRDAVAHGHGKLEGNLEWVGSPLDLDYATLGGALSLHVEDGRFLKVDTRGAGRLLTLLSLQSLSRTLLADTRETFGEGFTFSSIRADATVARGIISTQDFRMAGTGAAALMSGSIDLLKETQQLHLIVLPEIDASTAALAVAVANPVIGLGALLANTVLKSSLSKVFALEYDITGTWSEPVVVRRGRITPDSTEQPK